MTDTETSSFESPLKVDKDWKEKFFYPANHVEFINQIEKPVKKTVRKNNDALIIEDWVSDDEEQDESKTKSEKKIVIPTAAKIEKNQLGSHCPNQQRKRIVNGNNYNKKDNDYYSKTFHSSAHRHMAPRAVLMKTGLKFVNTARPVNTVRSVNTGRPFSTARSFNIIRPSYTAHPKLIIHCARPRTYFQNQAQSTVHMPFSKRTAFTKRCFNQKFDTSRPFRSTVNTVRSVNTGRPFSTARSFNIIRPSYTAHPKLIIHCARPRTYFQNQAQSTVHRPFSKRTAFTKRCFNQKFDTGRPFRSTVNTVKALACWVWMPKNRVVDHVSKNISASVTLKRLDYIDAQGRFKGGKSAAKKKKNPEKSATKAERARR
ncbi:hypothetical protein Tco_1487526 [Tanacetum coccineum]